MRAVVITRHGPPEVLEVRELPAPERPLGGQVLVDVRAAGINFADTLARMGLYQEAPKPPCVVGYEIAGEVAAIGPGVDGVDVGDRVVAGTRFGGYAEQVVVKATNVVPLPDRLSFEAGTAVPVNYATAGGGLVCFGASSVAPGERRNVVAALRTVVRMPRFSLIKQMSESKSVIGLNMLALWDDKGTMDEWVAPLRELLEDGTIQPIVAQT